MKNPVKNPANSNAKKQNAWHWKVQREKHRRIPSGAGEYIHVLIIH